MKSTKQKMDKQQRNQSKSWLFKKTNNITKSLERITKERTQTIIIRNNKGGITINSIDIKGVIRKYQQLYASKFNISHKKQIT